MKSGKIVEIADYQRARGTVTWADRTLDHLMLHYLILTAWVAANVAFLKWVLRRDDG